MFQRLNRGGWPYPQPPNVPFEINRASSQSEGLGAWWPMLASRGSGMLRELVRGYGTPITNAWSQSSKLGSVLDINGAGIDTTVDIGTPSAWTLNIWGILKATSTSNAYYMSLSNDVTIGVAESDHGTNPNQYFVPFENFFSGVAAVVGVLDMVTLTHDGTDFRFYVNGIETASKTAGYDALGGIHIGEFHNGASDINAYMGDTRAYPIAKTPAQVWQMYTNLWELYRPRVRRLWAMAPAAPAVGQPMMLRGTTVPGLRQWHPRV